MKYLLSFLVMFNLSFSAEYGVCELDTMNTQQAMTYIKKVLQKEPENVNCLVKLANLHLKQGELLKGFDLISTAYALDPQEVEKNRVSPILDMALSISKLKAQAIKNKDKEAWNEIGEYFKDMGVNKEAINAFEKSLEIDDTQEIISLKLSYCYKKANQNFKAFEELQRVLNLNPKNFYANFYMGKIMKYSIKDILNSQHYFETAKSILENDKNVVSEKEYPKFLSAIMQELNK